MINKNDSASLESLQKATQTYFSEGRLKDTLATRPPS